MAKSIIDQSKAENPERAKADKEAGINQGIANKLLPEPLPTYDIADCETVTKGRNNSFIIMGRDRPNITYSGYGGRGATQAGRIDLIAGMSSAFRHKDGSYGPPNSSTITSPNFAIDAARIYISQKADIDKYMGLDDVPGQASRGKSAIGLKADVIRIHSRRDIKIVTGQGKFEGVGRSGERLSNGGKNETVGTISLIAGNNAKDKRAIDFDFLNPQKIGRSTVKGLQPIPKGNNLEECLTDILLAMQELSAMVGENVSSIQKMDLALATHVHTSAPPGPPGPSTYVSITGMIQAKSGATIAGRKMLNKKIEMLKSNYLDVIGSRYINSNFVYTT